MISLPQLQRDLREVEAQLRLTRSRLSGYEALGEATLAAHTRQVVAGLESTRQALASQAERLNTAHAN